MYCVLIIDNRSYKFVSIEGNKCMEVHAFLCECSSLIETAEFGHTSIDNLILLDTKDLLLLQSFNSVDDAEGHANWQSWSDSDRDETEKPIDKIWCVGVIANNKIHDYICYYDDDQNH